jgi:hypothetical protein
MEDFKRFLITVDTNWYGMKEEYGAYAKSEEELLDLAQELAYENFYQYDCYELLLDEHFPDREEVTDEMNDTIADIESDYYWFNIEEYIGDDEDWGYLKIIYDSRQLNV